MQIIADFCDLNWLWITDLSGKIIPFLWQIELNFISFPAFSDLISFYNW